MLSEESACAPACQQAPSTSLFDGPRHWDRLTVTPGQRPVIPQPRPTAWVRRPLVALGAPQRGAILGPAPRTPAGSRIDVDEVSRPFRPHLRIVSRTQAVGLGSGITAPWAGVAPAPTRVINLCDDGGEIQEEEAGAVLQISPLPPGWNHREKRVRSDEALRPPHHQIRHRLVEAHGVGQ